MSLSEVETSERESRPARIPATARPAIPPSGIISAGMASAPRRSSSQPDDLKKALEEFVFDNPELERLEEILDTFNPFVASGWSSKLVER